MQETVSQVGPLRSDTLKHLARHLEAESSRISERLVGAYKREIAEYRSLPEGFIDNDIARMARQNLLTMLKWLNGDAESDLEFEDFKNSAVRRFRQGVSVQALLHAYRLWGQIVWEEVAHASELQSDPSIGLMVASEVMRYTNAVSIAVANSYLEESAGIIQDKQLAERDALEELISDRPLSQRVSNYLHRLDVKLNDLNCLILLRKHHIGAVEGAPMRDHLAKVRDLLSFTANTKPLVGVREDEIIVILPVEDPSMGSTRILSKNLAVELKEFVVGVSRSHRGLSKISKAYQEAHDATRAADKGNLNRAYFYTDALLQRLVDRSELVEEIFAETLEPLLTYDRKNHAELENTLRRYVENRFSLTETANSLHVHPNTIRYRLERIHQICGRDPFEADDLLLLSIGTKVQQRT